MIAALTHAESYNHAPCHISIPWISRGCFLSNSSLCATSMQSIMHCLVRNNSDLFVVWNVNEYFHWCFSCTASQVIEYIRSSVQAFPTACQCHFYWSESIKFPAVVLMNAIMWNMLSNIKHGLKMVFWPPNYKHTDGVFDTFIDFHHAWLWNMVYSCLQPTFSRTKNLKDLLMKSFAVFCFILGVLDRS